MKVKFKKPKQQESKLLGRDFQQLKCFWDFLCTMTKDIKKNLEKNM